MQAQVCPPPQPPSTILLVYPPPLKLESPFDFFLQEIFDFLHPFKTLLLNHLNFIADSIFQSSYKPCCSETRCPSLTPSSQPAPFIKACPAAVSFPPLLLLQVGFTLANPTISTFIGVNWRLGPGPIVFLGLGYC